jgi:hypothetical protein
MMVETHQNKDKDKLLFYSKIVLKKYWTTQKNK